MANPPISVIYRGVTYKRNPAAEQRVHRVYYQATSGKFSDERGSLHRDIWRDNHPDEDIPPGWHIHHNDHDPFNNDPGNLVLRSPEQHAAEHPELAGMPLDHLAAIRSLATEWHRSEEGRAWHREHAKRGWENREPRHRKVCAQCGIEFMSWFDNRGRPETAERYCSRRCINRAIERKYMETVTCPICGADFERNRYRPERKRTCSRKCGAALRKQRAAR